ncbi:hypothetical protein [Actinopolymorpha pittospori]|uniref:Uncharacterized protein n=1 Tax=Actinopolymorpha pittospori TaxID=648752 RepID=A0A927MRK1_9ACTN|nr:hypothetical protein [Actinopolymorpha pittospori]MBE1605585.1 hypothetical protein [Actinopolymorpha pittospori]
MSDESRRAVVAALIRLADSTEYRDRADAGTCLASYAEMPEAGATLRRLVLDAVDTYVTRWTAAALLRRMDRAGFAMIASAFASADDQTADWIFTAVEDTVGHSESDLAVAMAECAALTSGDDDELVRSGAGRLLEDMRQALRATDPQN